MLYLSQNFTISLGLNNKKIKYKLELIMVEFLMKICYSIFDNFRISIGLTDPHEPHDPHDPHDPQAD